MRRFPPLGMARWHRLTAPFLIWQYHYLAWRRVARSLTVLLLVAESSG